MVISGLFIPSFTQGLLPKQTTYRQIVYLVEFYHLSCACLFSVLVLYFPIAYLYFILYKRIIFSTQLCFFIFLVLYLKLPFIPLSFYDIILSFVFLLISICFFRTYCFCFLLFLYIMITFHRYSIIIVEPSRITLTSAMSAGSCIVTIRGKILLFSR